MEFAPIPNARASWHPGTLYCVDAEGWVYYGQVSAVRGSVGFLRYRTKRVDVPRVLAAHPLMNRIGINWASLGRALRAGRWQLLDRFELHPGFAKPYGLVQCPVNTNNVAVWLYQDHPGRPSMLIKKWQTRINDSEIQDFEVIASWDAEYHVPGRLKADFGQEEADWNIIGPVWRYRKVQIERARRFPDKPWHRLPTD